MFTFVVKHLFGFDTDALKTLEAKLVAAFDELKTDIGAVAASQQATKDAVLAAVATEGVRPNDHACQNQTRHIYAW